MKVTLPGFAYPPRNVASPSTLSFWRTLCVIGKPLTSRVAMVKKTFSPTSMSRTFVFPSPCMIMLRAATGSAVTATLTGMVWYTSLTVTTRTVSMVVCISTCSCSIVGSTSSLVRMRPLPAASLSKPCAAPSMRAQLGSAFSTTAQV
eukprot:scaffold69739_cov30-Tisochrysis_lutea.AAC.6